jgi:hypothetical protein
MTTAVCVTPAAGLEAQTPAPARGKDQEHGNAGRNGGKYHTPHPLKRAMSQIEPLELGETFYDGVGGSMGFLCEAFDYLRKQNPKRNDYSNPPKTKYISTRQAKRLASLSQAKPMRRSRTWD